MTPPTYETLCRATRGELEQTMRAGAPPALADLAGWEFRGYNTNPVAELIRVRKFKKGFEGDPGQHELMGYNVRMRQNGLLAPWVPVLRRGEPIREFPYVVRATPAGDRFANALLLDYGLPGALPLPPTWLRDYLVQVTPENRDLLLGVAYAALGPIKLFVGYFVLERYNRAL